MSLLAERCTCLISRHIRVHHRQATQRLASTTNQLEKRSPHYSRLSTSDVAYFERLLTKSQCITDGQALSSFNTDWLKTCRGASQLVLMPRTRDEASAVMRACNERRLAVCSQGGNTGLVGGSVPVYDEIVLSSRLMNAVIALDADAGVLKCQSGCVLQTLDEHVATRAGLMMPIDLGAKGSCHIGGNVATNAGGLRLLRYGSLKGNVLGLEVVLADGTILNTMDTSLRKDNTGYDLNQLFIGSEGTLGFITGVSILCPKRPKSTNVIVIEIEGTAFDSVIEVFKIARGELNEILSAFEFWDREAMTALEQNLSLENPFGSATAAAATRFYCLAETHGSSEEHDLSKIERFYSKLNVAKLCRNAVIAETRTQFGQLWALRERLPESLARDGYNYKYDLSLPVRDIYKLVEDMRARLSGSRMIRCAAWAHLGDGNLHLNVSSQQYDESIHRLIEPYVFEWTKSRNGSISAEHGIGRHKINYLHFSKSQLSIDYMKRIKKMFDPNMILNPYKTIPC